MLSAAAHQIVLVVNGIYLLENLKLGNAAPSLSPRKATSGMARGRA
jgi:hypothetical protein